MSNMKVSSVHDMSEEMVAVLFALFSRSTGDMDQSKARLTAETSETFHRKMTIGYGHKSVGDHATAHFAMENVSMVLERRMLTSRLCAATAKSTRYVDFSKVGIVMPNGWPEHLREDFQVHVEALMDGYERLVPMAIDAIRSIIPFDSEAGSSFKSKSSWESSTEKRGFDLVRDVLPAGVETSFGMTMSATAARELLDKLSCDHLNEAREASAKIRKALNLGPMPTLIPDEPRNIQWHQPLKMLKCGGEMSVRVVSKPNWKTVEELLGEPIHDAIRRWNRDRFRHMPPDRSSEMATYGISAIMPYAIARDLGRHRMMTQLWSLLTPTAIGRDPLFDDPRFSANLARVKTERELILGRAITAARSWMSSVDPHDLQYACPMACMVRGSWMMSVRELVHMIGLRTTPQGHPGYRRFCQMMASAVSTETPEISGMIREITNFDTVLIGRPG